MRLVDEIPAKLLDCPEIQNLRWPPAFTRLGRAVRIDYATPIHGIDESEADGLRRFAHVFTSGVDVLTPGDEGTGLDEAVAPIMTAVIDRLLVAVVVGDGDQRRECVACYERKGVGDDVGEAVDEVIVFDLLYLAWDPEEKRLLAVTRDGDPVAVLSGGFLALDPEGMIAG